MKYYQKDYPRPQFVRKEWINLNGNWDFLLDDKNLGEKDQWFNKLATDQTINVPFTYETKLSGISDEEIHSYVWYGRDFQVELGAQSNRRLILHFEGSDYITKVWVNGTYMGKHQGGYSRFSFDITDSLNDGNNHLIVKVEDLPDEQQPRGKQRWISNNYGCWYVQTTGIWKTVWSEWVPETSLDQVKMTPCVHDSSLDIAMDIHAAIYDDLKLNVRVEFDGKLVNEIQTGISGQHTVLKIPINNKSIDEWGVKLWTPDTPNLYDIKFELKKGARVIDTTGSYFGFRDITIDGQNILLNGTPIYQRLILDQGYWEDSHLTPPNEEALIEDIDKIKQLGYNGLRKHQKIEDERFLYWCDVKGMLVWSEFPATYVYSDYAVQNFVQEWISIVKQNYNHPSIITWTPINESWGVKDIAVNYQQQAFSQTIYHLTKSLDAMRPVIVNDGWEHTISDIITLHDYVEDPEEFTERYFNRSGELLANIIYFNKHRRAFAEGFVYKGQPIIISEFGGIAFNSTKEGWAWGYGNKVTTEEAFIKRFDGITSAIKKLPYCCGYCYTQVTDVQQEVNGLMDIKRNFKIDPEIISEINKR